LHATKYARLCSLAVSREARSPAGLKSGSLWSVILPRFSIAGPSRPRPSTPLDPRGSFEHPDHLLVPRHAWWNFARRPPLLIFAAQLGQSSMKHRGISFYVTEMNFAGGWRWTVDNGRTVSVGVCASRVEAIRQARTFIDAFVDWAQ
jgi:hypothetical protein